jgi:hypothetical protein
MNAGNERNAGIDALKEFPGNAENRGDRRL